MDFLRGVLRCGISFLRTGHHRGLIAITEMFDGMIRLLLMMKREREEKRRSKIFISSESELIPPWTLAVIVGLLQVMEV